MAEATAYEVIEVDELTVHKTVSTLHQQDGSVKYQNGLGRIWLNGERIPPEEVAEDWKEALDKGEGPLYEALKNKLRPVSDEPEEDLARRLGLPFDGYSEMDESDILRAMSVLPSATISRIKEFEANQEEPREGIVNYSVGFGETPLERQLTEIEEAEVDENKAVRALTTREVPEEGVVRPGEGVTGTGDPQIPYGVVKEGEEDSDAPKKGNIRGAAKKSAERRGRRDRQPKPTPGTPKDQGGSSLESTNDD